MLSLSNESWFHSVFLRLLTGRTSFHFDILKPFSFYILFKALFVFRSHIKDFIKGLKQLNLHLLQINREALLKLCSDTGSSLQVAGIRPKAPVQNGGPLNDL